MGFDHAGEGEFARGARVIPIPPPVYYGAGFILGMKLHRAVPLPIGGRPCTAAAGVLGLACGVGLTAGGAREIIRHRTTVVPHHPVSALVTTGVYRFSRNPMYTGLTLAYTGGALLAGSWWPLADLPVVLLLVRRLVIDPEEHYLSARFGEVYTDYRRRVRRWL